MTALWIINIFQWAKRGLIPLLFIFHLSLQATETLIDSIVLQVGQKPILASDIAFHRAFWDIQNSFAEKQGMPTRTLTDEQIIDMLIVRLLQTELADQVGIQVSDSDLNNYLTNISNNLNFDTISDLQADLGEQKFNILLLSLYEELKSIFIRQVILEQRIKISPQEVDAQFELINKPVYRITYALIYEEYQNQIDLNAIKTAMLDQASVETIKKHFVNSEVGRVITYEDTLQNLPKLIATQINQNSSKTFILLEDQSGTHFISFENIGYLLDQNQIEVDFIQLREIQMIPNLLMDDQKIERLLKKIKAAIESNEITFSEAARFYSANMVNNLSGGLGDSVISSHLPKPFLNAIATLKQHEISEPVKTDQGWYILALEEKSKKMITNEELKQQIRRSLFQEKSMTELQKWLGELKSNAYIQYF